MTEFNISSSELKFRIPRIAPTELMAITTQANFDNFEQTMVLFNFALEHIEVLVGEKWLPVKVKNRDVYNPLGIDEQFNVLNELINYFLTEVISKTFQKSSE